MIRKTAAVALVLVVTALPALADCPGHKVKQDQSAQTQTERPVLPQTTNS
ncbi:MULTISPECIES: hypothetical protein [Paracoccus]|nr:MULTISPECIES: hypothetical protein [Paracoccus]MCV2447049.1 hypothetical protein [Paracoccus sp. DMF]MDQ7775820.1 hypothetical protein [Paracoccus aminovorans]